MQSPTTESQEFPVRKATSEREERMRIPCPASNPLNPARKLKVVVVATIARGIKNRG